VSTTEALIDHAAELQREVYALQHQILWLSAGLILLGLAVFLIHREA
jgi:hypothetical protein